LLAIDEILAPDMLNRWFHRGTPRGLHADPHPAANHLGVTQRLELLNHAAERNPDRTLPI
jgi:hypothetical protein